jgi:hypothetical protein
MVAGRVAPNQRGDPEIASGVPRCNFGCRADSVAYNSNPKVYGTILGTWNAREPRFDIPRALRAAGRVAPILPGGVKLEAGCRLLFLAFPPMMWHTTAILRFMGPSQSMGMQEFRDLAYHAHSGSQGE